jgi:hypothetical protein
MFKNLSADNSFLVTGQSLHTFIDFKVLSWYPVSDADGIVLRRMVQYFLCILADLLIQ